MRRRDGLGWLAVLFLLLTLPSPVWAMERIRLAYAPSLPNGLISIAQQNGCFQAEGVEVVLERHPIGVDALDALLANRADMAVVADVPFMLASFNHADLRLIATIGTSDNDDKLVVRAEPGVEGMADLRGRAIGVQPMTSFHYFLHLLLQKQNMTESDVRLVTAQTNALPDALAKGTVDAFLGREPVISQAKQRFGGTVRLLEEPGLYRKSANLVVRQAWLDQHLVVATQLLRALYQAEKVAYQSRPMVMAILAQVLNVPPATLEPDWRTIRLRLTLTQALLLMLENEAEWAMGHGWNQGRAMPNFLHHMDSRAMQAAKPFGVTLLP
ncbi:MAG: NrtA/SsuA/CpmA family ABC transporter substrate-binding protein [Magnetococcales bacterium]|nr:NrtA/SsuA/CpmA family ABC transporter substrate-binding protein [Magnetococcales bacterium]